MIGTVWKEVEYIKEKAMDRNQMNYEFCDGMTHTVKQGDTLYEISRMHNVPLAMLLRANPYVDVFNLKPGDTICVPAYETQTAPLAVEKQMKERSSVQTEPPEQREEEQRASAVVETTPQREQVAADRMAVGRGETTDRMPVRREETTDRTAVSREETNGRVPVHREEMTDRMTSHREETDTGKMQQPVEGICQKKWEKYVVQPGDTLGDVMKKTSCDMNAFMDKNGMDTLYLLPGVAYYICR